MKIEIRSRGFELTEAERALAERRLTLELARFAERIERVVLHCTQERQPRGGVEKRCRVEVRIRPRTVRVEHVAADVRAAIEHAARLAARSVARKLERERELD